MNKQISLSALSDELVQVRTKKKEFLTQIERIYGDSGYLGAEKRGDAVVRNQWGRKSKSESTAARLNCES